MAYEDKNIARRCKDCGEFYYLHPDVWKDDKSALMHLEYKYQKGEPFTAHVCHNNKPTESKYNYEEQKLQNPDEVYKKIKPNYIEKKTENNNNNNRPRSDISEHVGITKQFLKDMEQMRQEVSEIKMLLQAVIKIFDVATRKSNKQGDSLLFQKASSMVDEERVNIEETKKITSETDDVDDDDGNVPEESSEVGTEEDIKKEEE
jgi:hypothetical protein